MAKFKVNVNLHQLSTIDKKLTEMADIQLKAKAFVEELGNLGYDTASLKFSIAQYDGYNDVVVNIPYWKDEHTLVLSAKGKAITFIEFGSGSQTYIAPNELHPMANELGMIRGDFGYKLGRFTKWRYKGVPGTNGEVIESGSHKGEILTKGNPANRCMFDASQDMRNNIQKIAREVFSK